MLKLNLASGSDLKPADQGWQNLDIVPRWPGTARGCDVVWDARKDPIPYSDGSADEVYAGYLLLHLAPRFHEPVLAEVHRVLAPGGVLVVGEVDMAVVLQRWLEAGLRGEEAPREAELIWGEQGNVESTAGFDEFDKHCHGFTEASLRHLLGRHGFTELERVWLHQVYYELTLRCRKE